MTIETTRAPEGAKPASSAASRGTSAANRPGAVGALGAAGAGGGGFAGLMSLLSVPDAAVAPLAAEQPVSDTVLTLPVPAEDKGQNMPLVLDGQGLIAMSFMPDALLTVAPAMVSTVQTAATDVTALAGAGTAFALAEVNPPSVLDANATSRTAGSGAVSLLEHRLPPALSSTSQTQTEPSEASSKIVAQSSDVASLLDHRRASQSHAAAQTQFELRDARFQPASVQALAAQDASRAAPVLLAADAMPGLTDRREGRPGAGPTRTGLEGALGGTVADRLGINASYEVAAASAVVPEGQVAETVSYWASHGVQSAELTLDGLGDEPVEVRISVEGDQAQIDFRSNQPEVRQALESASAQLKALLSGEGLQLTGMSVGTSGRGSAQGEGGQPKPSSRQTKLVSVEPPRSSAARPANAAVGQALDLYV